MNISAVTVRRPVLVCMATLIILLIGLVAFFRIPVDLMPDTSIPTLTVYARYPGAGPEEVENMLARPIEDALSSLEGLKYIQSMSRSGFCRVRLIFDWGDDLDEVMRNVQQMVDKVANRLPEDVDKPQIYKYDPNDVPVLVYGITSSQDPVELSRRITDEIVPVLSRVDGVGNIDVLGATGQEVKVVLDLKKIKALRLTLSEIAGVIKRENFSMSVGTVQTGLQRLNLRISADIDKIWKLRRTVIRSSEAGTIFLSDIASVSISPAKIRSFSYIDGERGIRLAINKAPGKNTIDVARQVQKVVNQFQASSDDVKLTEIFNTASYIQSSIRNVQFSVLYGGVLAILVLLFFLRNVRSTLVIGVSIPVSIIATFGLIYFGGLSLNLMTIGGLGLGIGMLVDNAIVVLENIMRMRHTGASVIESSIRGGHDVQSSIIASTITTLIVFLPVIFLEGVTSVLFKELAIVVTFAMLVSLASAILLIPTLCSLFIRGSDDPERVVERGLWGVSSRFFDRLEQRYARILAEALRVPKWTILICLLLFGTALALIPRIGSEFMPSADSDEIRLTATHSRGTEQAVIESTMQSIIATLRKEFPEIVHSVSYVRDDSENNRAYINLSLVSPSARSESARELLLRIRDRFSMLPGVSLQGHVPRSPFTPKLPNTSGDLAEIEIRGYELSKFIPIAEQVKASLEQISGVDEIVIPDMRTASEKMIRINKVKATELGIPLKSIGDEIKMVLSGVSGGTFFRDGIELPVRLSVYGDEEVRPEDVLEMTINNRSDEPIRLGNLLTVEDYEGPATINRDNRQRIQKLNVRLDDSREPSFVLQDMEAELRELSLPAGFSVILGGNYQQQKESNRSLMFSIVLVILLIYMVMAAQFESLLHPFVIMFSVPLAAIGVFWTLYLTGTTFNMQSNMGCVMLAGIVVNNAILLVDQTNKLRAEKMEMTAALLEAGRRRLRPILMTTATTVLGLLPLAIGMGDGGEAQAPMARAVMGGLLSSTFITLVLVPVIYSIFEKRKTH